MQHLSVGTKSQRSRNKNNSQKNLGLKRETEKGRLQNKTDLIDSRLGVCVHEEKRTSTIYKVASKNGVGFFFDKAYHLRCSHAVLSSLSTSQQVLLGDT